ncbi:MAG: GNAT family N-acetyltransferase [Burkholderiales bacterium]
MPNFTVRVVDSLAAVSPDKWDVLTADNPTLKHAWLQSMIDAGCTTAATGWLAQFVLLERDVAGTVELAGAVPLYMKAHSYGEYVFDWAWADAYQRAGLDYYPKLLCAIPFTPCTGSRLLAANRQDRKLLLAATIQIAKQSDVSSLHILFPAEDEQALIASHGLLARQAVQFHWRNDNYRSFEDFLSRMSHDKRKRIKQERRRVTGAGVTLRRVSGPNLTSADWDLFYLCYQSTYQAHRSTPYLNRQFFALIGERMCKNVLMVIAEKDGAPIAASLNLVNKTTLFGRYWGATEFVSGLHFETCYYQTIEYCIENGLTLFEGGAQGEHKLARGFVPVKCVSAHLIKDARFASAVTDFLRRESNGIERYVDELNEHQPYKTTDATSELASDTG